MQNQILIGVPCLDFIRSETVASLFQATAGIDCPAKLAIHKSCYIHDARNKIVENAIDNKATHVMFIDSDMQFGMDSIARLLAHDVDIVGGLYYRRQAPHLPTISQLVDEKIVVPNKFPKDKLFKVWAIATGFLLVKTEVFKSLTPPYFFFGNYKTNVMGEDTYFCWKANKKFDIWCDPTIDLGHVGEETFTNQHYNLYKDPKDKKLTENSFNGELE